MTDATGAATADAGAAVAVEFVVPAAHAGWRLDRSLAALSPDLSRAHARGLIEGRVVAVDGVTVADPRLPVSHGRVLTTAYVQQVPMDTVTPQAMPLVIVAEEDDFIVLDKPAGLVVHPGVGVRDGTLANGLAAHSAGGAALPRGGLVHRLDRDTSGLVVAAKTPRACLDLKRQFQDKEARREYVAIVHGTPAPSGVIDRPIGRDPASRVKRAVVEGGRPALTRWRLLGTARAYALVECTLESGRTHQIRVHMQQAGHPVAGDRVYSRHARAEGGRFARQMLHARRLEFTGPADGQPRRYDCALPADFGAGLEHAGLAGVR